jgi:hypothetical protein
MLSVGLQAQETTAGLQGTVKDAGGAVVPKALVELNSSALVGSKTLQTDGTGYYRFANLPPGTYAVTVKAGGFATLKREGVTLEVGHLPTLDLVLKVGSAETVVEVTAEAPLIDLTTNTTLTNVTEDVIADVPHGRSFQSVIQFAPSARNEPLAGGSLNANAGVTSSVGGTGAGNSSPGNGGNGNSFGYSVAGGADSENSYLVEGQETANLIGGYSHTNVPFEFIQEVQVKSSGVEAQYGGSLGGVVNVIMKHGSNDWHGSLGTSYESGNMDGSPNAYTRYDPQGSRIGLFDPDAQGYQPQKDHLRDIQPSATVGGAIWKDHVWAFLGFAPEYISRGRSVNFGTYDANAGLQVFNRDQQTYYSNARIDAKVTNKATVFASWLYQHQREAGQLLPRADSTTGLFNPDATTPLDVYEHGYGYSAPDTTLNIGADITLTPRLVSTTRFGYFFENYHDFGFPTVGTIYLWQTSGSAASTCPVDPVTHLATACGGTGSVPFSPNGPEAGLIQAAGFQTGGWDPNFTLKNADKHIQFDQDIALFKSGWWGTHNLKGGYQLNRLSNDIFQRYSAPTVDLYPGATDYSYTLGEDVAGTYGDAVVVDFGTKGQATSYNHAFFAQDAWTIGKGVTINAGIRFEHENVPAESFGLLAGLPANPIEFGWGSKIGPRIGFAWDIFRDGRAKVFGSYGVFNDEMKLNLAISSFGGQWWNNCLYLLNDPNYKDIVVAPNSQRFYCQGNDPTAPASLTPTGHSNLNNFIENINYRGQEGTIAGLKPYRQHESVFGADYQIKKNLAFEARWDRRRLDNVIEDTAFFQNGSEVFFVANPGEGLNSYNTSCGSACPHNVKGARAYDGFEFRLNKSLSNNWYGMVSYTYSYFRGNYAGLTSTDLSDGGGGRNSPNNSRAFDETYFEFNAYGQPANGRLATDRPNTFKGYTYYQLPWGHKRATSTIGWIQYMYQGTPLSSYVDVGGWQQPNFAPVYPEGRGKWVDISQDPVTGTLTVNSVGLRRTPWYFQSDASFMQEFKPNHNNEKQVVGFQATISNVLNSRSAVAYGSQIDSANSTNPIAPSGLYLGQPGFYAAAEHQYPWKTLLNTDGVVLNSTYGKPIAYELSRTIRVQVSFTF